MHQIARASGRALVVDQTDEHPRPTSTHTRPWRPRVGRPLWCNEINAAAGRQGTCRRRVTHRLETRRKTEASEVLEVAVFTAAQRHL